MVASLKSGSVATPSSGMRSPVYGGPGSPAKTGNDEGSGSAGNGRCRLEAALAAPTRFREYWKGGLNARSTLDPKKLTRFAYRPYPVLTTMSRDEEGRHARPMRGSACS